MVDISKKEESYREAVAEGKIRLRPETIKAIRERRIEKGDVLATAGLAALNAVKKTSELLFYCHPLEITSVEPQFSLGEDTITVLVKVKSTGKTGVEMEALTGVSVALLTIWDMVKALEKDEKGQYPFTYISDIRVVRKIKNEFRGTQGSSTR
jgi:cyclic pyranopterin phosphate synthase